MIMVSFSAHLISATNVHCRMCGKKLLKGSHCLNIFAHGVRSVTEMVCAIHAPQILNDLQQIVIDLQIKEINNSKENNK